MSKEFHPLVSIVIPVYNGANYMREAINSALKQTYDNIEVIVINDGSTDDTERIAMSYGNKIRYFKKDNGGVVSALNFGIDNMNGEYFAWLSHDDLYMPKKIEKQVLALLENQGQRPAFCVCSCNFIDEKGREKDKATRLKKNSYNYPRCSLLIGDAAINGLMVLIPKTLFDICGKFMPSLATHEYDMWLRLMDVADIIVVSDYLVSYRFHEKQILHQKKQEVNSEIDKFLELHINEIPALDFEIFWENSYNDSGVLNFITVFMAWSKTYPSACYALQKKLTQKMLFKIINNNVVQFEVIIKRFFRALKNYGLVGTLKKVLQQLSSRK